MTTALAPPPEATTVTGQGTVRAIVAVTGVPDAAGDLIVPGAFADTLTRRRVALCAHHDQQRPIGRVSSAVELAPGDRRLPARTADGQAWPRAAGALVINGALNLGTVAGREAFAELKFYSDEGSWSIGYTVPPGGASQRGRVRHLRRVDLLHASPVLIGAHSLARTIEVKSHPGIGRTEVKALPVRRTAVISRTDRERARWSRLREIRSDVERKAGTVPLGEGELLRAERLRRDAARWEREDGDREPYTALVDRDPRFEMAADGTMYRVLACAGCGLDVTFPRRAPIPAGAIVRCEQCQGQRR